MSYLSDSDLQSMGFASLGTGVKISDKASIYRPELIHLGNHVRIDDFVVISPSSQPFKFGNYIHIGAHGLLVGRASISMGDYSGLSGRVSIYSSSDDYSGEFMTNPTVPEEFTSVNSAPVNLGEHVIIGAGAVLLPGVTIGKGSAISALSLVVRDIGESVIAGGVPCRPIKTRSRKCFDLEKGLNDSHF